MPYSSTKGGKADIMMWFYDVIKKLDKDHFV